MEDINKMWDAISKPPQYIGSSINDFFEVQFAALPHYEERHDDFVADTIVLRRRCAAARVSRVQPPVWGRAAGPGACSSHHLGLGTLSGPSLCLVPALRDPLTLPPPGSRPLRT